MGAIAWLRRTFVRGMLLLFPLAITYVILRWLFNLVAGLGGPLVQRILARMGTPISESPMLPILTPVIALLVTIGVVLLVGVVGGNFVGRRLWELFEELLLKVPLVRWFYGSARQMIDAFKAAGSGAFREVVLVEYPRRGIWCLGFITASAAGMSPGQAEEDFVYVFLPTTPNPTSGYTVLLPRSEAPPAGMTVDEGLKLIVSGGFIAPRPSRPGPATVSAER